MYSKRGVIVVVCCLLLLTMVGAAEEEVIFSGKVQDGDSTVFDGKTFGYRFPHPYNILLVDLPGGSAVSLVEGNCKSHESLQLCFYNSEFWYRNYTLSRDIFKANMRIARVIPLFTIDRTYSTEGVYVGETINAKLLLTNKGDLDAYDVKLNDVYKGFSLQHVSACVVSSNSLEWNGYIPKKKNLECTFTLTAEEPGERTYQAKISYDDGLFIKDVTSEGTTLTIHPYQLELNITGSKNIALGETMVIELALSNRRENSDLNVKKLEMAVPKDVIFVEASEGKFENGMYLWDRSVDEGDTKKIVVTLKPRTIGTYTLNPSVSYHFGGLLKLNKKSLTFDVHNPGVVVRSAQIRGKKDDAVLLLDMVNENKLVDFSDVRVTLDAENVVARSVSVGGIAAAEYKEVEVPLESYYGESGDIFPMSITLDYSDSAGGTYTYVSDVDVAAVEKNVGMGVPVEELVQNESDNSDEPTANVQEVIPEETEREPASIEISATDITFGIISIIMLVAIILVIRAILRPNDDFGDGIIPY